MDKIKREINVPGVVRIHDLHVWALTPSQWVLTAHLVIGKGPIFSVISKQSKNWDYFAQRAGYHNLKKIIAELKCSKRIVSLTFKGRIILTRISRKRVLDFIGQNSNGSSRKRCPLEVVRVSSKVDGPKG